MKTLKYILILILGMGMFNSCLFEEDTTLELNGKGPNIGGFDQARTSISAIADGTENKFDIKVKVFGPTSMDLKNDVVLTIGADPSSTAVLGKHYKLDNPTVTLSPGQNMLGFFKLTMLTAGIKTPLAVSPVLVLKVTQVSGDPMVVNSGKPISITMNYACPSFLEGTYDVTTEYTAYDGKVSILNWTEKLTKTGIGQYRTERVGHWTAAVLGGTPGFTFSDVCSKISVSGQNLVELYSNWVEGTAFGSVDEATGTITIEYSICVDNGARCRYYKSTYVKK